MKKRDSQIYLSAARVTVTGTLTTRNAADDSARVVPRTFATAGENARYKFAILVKTFSNFELLR